MVKQRNPEQIVTLEEALSRFAAWRSKPVRARRIPDELWDAAVSLCGQHSICKVSRLLRLDYKTLRLRILVAVEPIDFRKGIDGLCRLCRMELQSDPFSGALFVFCNKRRTALRILSYDGQGFWLCHKRLSSGRLRWVRPGGTRIRSLAALELQTLIWNGDLSRLSLPALWRAVSPRGVGP